jgi:transcriptional regulator with XRE-family HTH domain
MRESAVLTQEVLALAAGLRSRSIISEYEGGTIEIPARYYEPLARACGFKAAELLKPPGAPLPRRRVRSMAAPMRPERVTRRFHGPTKINFNRRFFISYRRNDAGMSAVLERIIARTHNITTGLIQ